MIERIRAIWAERAPRPAWCVAAMLTMHAALVARGAASTFATCDEVGYLQAGLSHWRAGDFAMYRVNPPLPRMLGTLPVLAVSPSTDFSSLESYRPYPGARLEFKLQNDFLRANGRRFLDLLYLARLSNVVWSVLGGALLARWAGSLFGPGAMLVAAALWCFDPTVLAHAAVFTPDIPATVAGLAATFVFARYLEAPSWRRALVAGLVLGVAELTKFTLLLLYPVFGALFAFALARACRRPGAPRPHPAQAAAALALSLVVLNAGYGFGGVFRRLDSLPFVSTQLSGLPPYGRGPGRDFWSNRFVGRPLGALRLPVPEEFARGIDVQRRDFELGLRSYLDGEWRNGGFWNYYLRALLLKEPLGTLALFGVALLPWRRPRQAAAGEAPGTRRVPPMVAALTPLVATLAFVSSQTGFSHHMRYVLPIFPFAFLAAARVGAGGRALRAFAALAVAQAAASSLAVAPRSLAYFNELGGGPLGGSAHLLDSNLDWGQDLLELEAWLRARPDDGRRLSLAYFNQVPAESIGLAYRPLPKLPIATTQALWDAPGAFGPLPGLQAISVSYLRGSRFPAGDGAWGRLPVLEHDYEYLRELTPVARAGYTIFIYDVTLEQANAVRRRWSLPELPAGWSEGAPARRVDARP